MALSLESGLNDLAYPQLARFTLHNLQIKSETLKNNPLRDPYQRNNPVAVPRKGKPQRMGLIFILPGFASNGPRYLADKGFEETFLQQLDLLMAQNKAPLALYVFIDAWTLWGGSQFVNSSGTGLYEDYIVKEIYPTLKKLFDFDPKKVAVIGQSSGGYGALHLASKFPQYFPYGGAIAPDCFFEASLLPDFYKAAPFLRENNSYLKLKTLQKKRQIIKQKLGFSILNAMAMTACYSPKEGPSRNSQGFDWPIDLYTGKLDPVIWKRWIQRDPISFLPQRQKKLKKLAGLYIDVGQRDEFHLQMGTRQIHQWLTSKKIPHHYSEYSGGHFDSHDRYPFLWQWLLRKWQG